MANEEHPSRDTYERVTSGLINESENFKRTPSSVKQVIDKIKKELNVEPVEFEPMYCQITMGTKIKGKQMGHSATVEKNIIKKAGDIVKTSSAKRYVFAVLPVSSYNAFRSAGIDGHLIKYSIGTAPANHRDIYITNKSIGELTNFGTKPKGK
jgi:hypothetical protein